MKPGTRFLPFRTQSKHCLMPQYLCILPLLFSPSKHQHSQDLRRVFTLLQDHGLVINLDKCQFGVLSIEFLGHQISTKGVFPLPSKIKAITDFPQPNFCNQLEEYMLNFYHHLVPNIVSILRPLYQAMLGKPKPKILKRTPDMIIAFQTSKQTLADATMLTHPSTTSPIFLVTDASDTGIGCLLYTSPSPRDRQKSRMPSSA